MALAQPLATDRWPFRMLAWSAPAVLIAGPDTYAWTAACRCASTVQGRARGSRVWPYVESTRNVLYLATMGPASTPRYCRSTSCGSPHGGAMTILAQDFRRSKSPKAAPCLRLRQYGSQSIRTVGKRRFSTSSRRAAHGLRRRSVTSILTSTVAGPTPFDDGIGLYNRAQRHAAPHSPSRARAANRESLQRSLASS